MENIFNTRRNVETLSNSYECAIEDLLKLDVDGQEFILSILEPYGYIAQEIIDESTARSYLHNVYVELMMILEEGEMFFKINKNQEFFDPLLLSCICFNISKYVDCSHFADLIDSNSFKIYELWSKNVLSTSKENPTK